MTASGKSNKVRLLVHKKTTFVSNPLPTLQKDLQWEAYKETLLRASINPCPRQLMKGIFEKTLNSQPSKAHLQVSGIIISTSTGNQESFSFFETRELSTQRRDELCEQSTDSHGAHEMAASVPAAVPMDISLSDSDEDAPEHRPRGFTASPTDTISQLTDLFAPRPRAQERPRGSQAYIPYWSDPAWTPELAISGDGRLEYPTTFGNPDNIDYTRPALLPSDIPRLPTEYALYAHFCLYSAISGRHC